MGQSWSMQFSAGQKIGSDLWISVSLASKKKEREKERKKERNARLLRWSSTLRTFSPAFVRFPFFFSFLFFFFFFSFFFFLFMRKEKKFTTERKTQRWSGSSHTTKKKKEKKRKPSLWIVCIYWCAFHSVTYFWIILSLQKHMVSYPFILLPSFSFFFLCFCNM